MLTITDSPLPANILHMGLIANPRRWRGTDLCSGLGLLLENRAGQIAPQGWEFYVAMASLFLTFAFPGFVWRYLRRSR